MKRIFAVFAVLALMAGMAMAQPSIYGSNGLLRIVAPNNNGPMNFGVGVHGVIWMKDSTASAPWKVNQYFVVPAVNFSINDMFELSVAPVYQMQKITSGGVAVNNNGLLDTRAALKFSYKMSDMFCLGVYAGFDIPTIADTLNPYAGDSIYKHTGTVHALLIPGFDFGAAKLNLNVGLDYTLDKYEVAGTNYVYPTMAVPFGLGFSYKASDMFMPFLEVSGSYWMDTTLYAQIGATTVKRGVMNNPLWITPGVRVSFPFGLHIDAAFDYNLQTKDSTLPGLTRSQDWQIIAGMSYAPIKTTGPKVPPTGSIAGKVTDAKGKGLAATITAGGLTANTDPATGAYTLAGLPITKTPLEIKADAKLYVAKSGSVILTKKTKKTPAVQDFALDLKPIPMGAAKGLVKDAITGAPVEASIAFAGPKAETGKVVAGAYSANLQVGNYTATAAAAGYFDKVVIVAIAEKGTATNDFVMLKKGTVVPVEVVWTAANKAVVKTVNVEAVVKALQDNPKAKLVITAIVDRVGGKKMNQTLANGRADGIRAELVKANIDAARITTVGQLAAPAGKTNAQRAANTKVEVSFVE